LLYGTHWIGRSAIEIIDVEFGQSECLVSAYCGLLVAYSYKCSGCQSPGLWNPRSQIPLKQPGECRDRIGNVDDVVPLGNVDQLEGQTGLLEVT
jgi:hypothetical protein